MVKTMCLCKNGCWHKKKNLAQEFLNVHEWTVLLAPILLYRQKLYLWGRLSSISLAIHVFAVQLYIKLSLDYIGMAQALLSIFSCTEVFCTFVQITNYLDKIGMATALLSIYTCTSVQRTSPTSPALLNISGLQ